MKTNNIINKGLNFFVEMVLNNSNHNYAVNDTRLINFGKNTYFKRARSRKGYGLFS